MRTASDLYRNKPNTSPKMPETPLLQRVFDGEVFAEHLTRHFTKHLTILGTPPSLPIGEEPQVAHVGGDASLRRNST